MMKARRDVPTLSLLGVSTPNTSPTVCKKTEAKHHSCTPFPPPPCFPSFHWIPKAHPFVFSCRMYLRRFLAGMTKSHLVFTAEQSLGAF